MSLKNIGNILDAGDDINEIKKVLEGIGDITAAAKALNYSPISGSDKVSLLNGLKETNLGGIANAASVIKDVAEASGNAGSKLGGLGEAFSGLSGIIKANPITAGAGIAVAAAGIGAVIYKNIKAGYVKAADEATQIWNTTLSDLQSKISKYTELKNQLDSGTLSDSETLSVKRQILDIQNQISAAYGTQANGIDLVNGKLDTQINKMLQISESEASRNINENRKAYEDAEYEMTRDNRRYELGLLDAHIPNPTNDYGKARNEIESIAKKYESKGIHLKDYNQRIKIEFEGDASQAEVVINEFETEVEQLKKKYGEDSDALNVIQPILEQSSSKLLENEKVLDAYQGNYNAYLQQSMYANGDGQLLSGYAASIQNYNEALLSGDSAKIHEAAQAFAMAADAKNKFLSESGNGEYSRLFDDMENSLDNLSLKYHDFQESLTTSPDKNNIFKDQADGLKKYAKHLQSLKTDTDDVVNALMNDGHQKGEDAIRGLATAWGITASSSESDIRAFADALADAEVVSDSLAESGTNAADSYNELVSNHSQHMSKVDDVNAALVNNGTGRGLTSGFDSTTQTLTGDVANLQAAYMDLQDASGKPLFKNTTELSNTLFEKTATGIHLNVEALRELQAMDEANTKSKYLQQQIDLQNQLDEAIANQPADQNSEDYAASQSNIDSLRNQLDTVNLLSAAYDGATSAYQKWVNAQSSGEEGDMYDTFQTAISRGDELLESGLTGTKEFRSIADLFAYGDQSTASVSELVEAYKKASPQIKKFFSEGQEGTQQFVDYLKENNFADVFTDEEGNKNIKFNAGSEDEIARMMGIDIEAVEAIKGKLNDYAYTVSTETLGSDEMAEKVAEAVEQAQEAKDYIQGLLSDNEFSTSIDLDTAVSELDENGIEERIEGLESLKNEFEIKFGADSAEVENVNLLLDEANARKQQLEGETLVNVTIESEEDLPNLAQEISNFPSEKTASLSVTVSDSDQIDAIAQELAQVPEDKTASVTFLVNNQADAQKITEQMAVINAEKDKDHQIDCQVNLVSGADNTEAPEGKEAAVNYIIGFQQPPRNLPAFVHYRADMSGLPSELSPIVRTVTYAPVNATSGAAGKSAGSIVSKAKQKLSQSSNKGNSAKVNGTAHANGTTPPIKKAFLNDGVLGKSYLNGNWSLPHDENALVGELGQEIIVRDGSFFTVGDYGAEFRNLKRGDIVFNHKQSQALLSHGWVTGRGKLIGGNSFANGTAYASGSADTSKENLKDWIATLTDSQKNANKRLSDAIDDFEMNYNQNRAIEKYVSDSTSYQNTLRQSANAYMSKANALGLSGSYVHKIWAGEMNLEDIQDEDLRDKISKYEDYYKKARDLNDEITDINREIRESKIKKLDNLKDDYKNLISLSESMADYNDSVSALSEKLNLVGDSDSLLNSLNAQAAVRQALVNEEAQLNTQLNALVSDGTIGMYTYTWIEWREEIDNIRKSIVKADTELVKLKEEIMEIRYDSFEKSLDALDKVEDMASAVRNLLSKEGIFEDAQLTDSGYAQLALMSTELVSAKQRVANYSAAIKALEKDLSNGNLTQAQFNKKLQDYQKDQLSAVKATKSARDAILDLVKDGIKEQTEAMEDLIDKRKKELSLMKQTENYQKDMEERSKEINSLRGQMAVLEGDDSDEAMAQRKNLNSKLMKLQEEYDEKLKDRERDILSDGYDDLKDKLKENQEDILKQLEVSSEAQAKAISEVLEAAKDKQAEVYAVLQKLSEEYQFTLTDSLTKPWESAQSALQQFQDSIGKLNANVSIDTSKITAAAPSANQTTPTQTEASSTGQITDNSKTGTWIKQDGRWWYQHGDGSYQTNGWEAIDGSWYRFDQQGWIQTGWVQDKNKWYYLEGSGAMAANKYVYNPDNGLYYWVNKNGEWEPQWDTKHADLTKYASVTQGSSASGGDGKVSSVSQTLRSGMRGDHVRALQQVLNALGYNAGAVDGVFGSNTAEAVRRFQSDNGISADGIVGSSTKSKFKLKGYRLGTASAVPGLHLMDEDGPGSEILITDQGILKQFNGGEHVFNASQVTLLHKLLDSNPVSYSIPDLPTRNINDYISFDHFTGETYITNNNFDSLLTVNGDIDKEVFPGMKETCKETFQYFTRKMKDISKKNGYQ